MLAWSKKYSIGVPRLDADHVTLISLLNQLHINMAEDQSRDAIEPVLTALHHYADSHFEFEESLMANLKYPDLERHKDCHNDFCSRIAELAREAPMNQDVARSLRALLGRWLFDHVVRVDGQFGAWLKNNRIVVPGFHRDHRRTPPPIIERRTCHA